MWPLYVGVTLGVLGIIAVLLRGESQYCADSDTGRHEDISRSKDNEAGRIWFRECLHCLRTSPGIEIPWIRRHSRRAL